MYPYPYPHTITNGLGEEITFTGKVLEDGIEKLLNTGRIQPHSGTVMHVHFKQDEEITVTQGKLGYQLAGEEEKFLSEGESIFFPKGVMHRFFNAGEEVLEVSGWQKPANSIDYFLTAVYRSMEKAGKASGDPFDSAYLMTRYKSEYDIAAIPSFIKKVIMPITTFVGKLLGKYEHFKDAPAAIK